MPSLREGLDKVMLTIREKVFEPKKYPYPKHIADLYVDRLQKLKFSDRYADTLFYTKYKWQTSTRNGVEKSTWGVQYWLRLDGMRQMRVMLNLQRLYNIFNNLEVYDKRLFDDNVVVPSVDYYLEEFVEIVQKQIYEIVNDYIALRKKVFNDVITYDDITVDTHQVEMIREGLGLHTSDVSQTFKEHSRADTITVYHDQVQTHYLTTSYRRQLKMYQKGVGIVRLEATYNERPQDIVWGWQKDDMVHIANSLRREFDRLMRHVGIPDNWWKPRVMKKKTFLWSLADIINLRDPSTKEVLSELLLVLLSLNSWKSDPRNEDFRLMTRRLVRKGLLKHSGRRGVYIPTDRLMFIKDIYWHFCDKENWIC